MPQISIYMSVLPDKSYSGPEESSPDPVSKLIVDYFTNPDLYQTLGNLTRYFNSIN